MQPATEELHFCLQRRRLKLIQLSELRIRPVAHERILQCDGRTSVGMPAKCHTTAYVNTGAFNDAPNDVVDVHHQDLERERSTVPESREQAGAATKQQPPLAGTSAASQQVVVYVRRVSSTSM